jgi:alkyl hydroperoxide reductase subunit AhpC
MQEKVEIVAVSVEGRELQQMMIDRVKETYGVDVDYRMLTDTDHRVIDRYGVFNPDEAKSRPVPHPTTMVIDLDGVIRWMVVELDYRMRPENEEVIAALEAVQ